MTLTVMALIPSLIPSNIIPRYSTSEDTWAQDTGGTKGTDRWLGHIDQKMLIPPSDRWEIIKGLHDSLHLGREAMSTMVFRLFTGKGLSETIKRVTQARGFAPPITQEETPRLPFLLAQYSDMGDLSHEDKEDDWQIDFTQMPFFQGFKYSIGKKICSDFFLSCYRKT